MRRVLSPFGAFDGRPVFRAVRVWSGVLDDGGASSRCTRDSSMTCTFSSSTSFSIACRCASLGAFALHVRTVRS